MAAIRFLKQRMESNQYLIIKHNTSVRNYCNVNSNLNLNPGVKNYQSIADFYTGKSIFVTGGSGLLGKVLVEKLLYSTKLDKIYLLIRDKKGVDVNTRLANMFESPVFSRIKKSCPDSLAKIVPIKGDVGLPNLGINHKDEKILIDQVSVIFHLAATIMFNEKLSVHMNTNFQGTQQVINLTKRIKNTEAFIHMSTAYAYPEKPVLLETIYPPPAEIKDVYKFLEEYGDDDKETMKFIKGYPSAYNFSKALAENCVVENHEDIPTAIIRPSMVSATINEPVKGWLDGWMGATSTLYMFGKGWDVITYGDKNNVVDPIPADYVANLSIISATRLKRSKEVHVYNCTSSSENPITLGKGLEYFIQECIKQGYNDLPHIFHIYSNSKIVVNLITIIVQLIPAHIADVWLKMKGEKPRYVRIMNYVLNTRNTLRYYTTKSWTLSAENTQKLYYFLSPEDQKLFPCNSVEINWPQYFKIYCNGVFKYLIKKYRD